MTKRPSRPDTVTVYGFTVFDYASRDMQVASFKATREAISAMGRAQLVQGTAEEVARDALDSQGRFRRLPTGWGELH